MRIITGIARGIALRTLPGEATRPTAEKVKEAVFSAIQFDIEGRKILDLFAGSGQMGLEALSRGASHCTFIDASNEAMAVIKENAKKTGFFECSHFLTSDYRNYIRKAADKDGFDIVFIDPPYAERAAADALERLWKGNLLKPFAIVITESEEENIFEGNEALAERFEVLKKKKYGRPWIHILRLRSEDMGDAEEAEG